MSRSHLRQRFATLPRTMQTGVVIAMVFVGYGFFATGVGSATLTETIIAAVQNKPMAPVLIGSQEGNAAPTTLKVEIVRNGDTICEGERTPTEKPEKANPSWMIERPIADCPPLRVGDTVRATWIQQTEVNISFRDPK